MLYAGLRRALDVVFRLGWRPVITGAQHAPATGPLIVAANHLSFIDSIVVPLALSQRRVTFLAKSEYLTDGGLWAAPRRALFRLSGAVPVQRGEQREARAALDTGLAVLARGWALGVYPEGTRSRDGRLYRGRTGTAWLALTSGAPILPVGLVGTDRMQPIGARVPRPCRGVEVHVGPLLHPQDYLGLPPAEARRLLTDDLMAAIAGLSGQEPTGVFNERAG